MNKKKYLSYTGLKTFKCPASPGVSRNYSHVEVKTNVPQLNAYFLTGFSDAESTFIISIRKKSDLKLKWSVELAFSISVNKKDLKVLELIKDYLGVGNIFYNKKDDCYHFTVASVKDLTNVIIPHFDKYPLLSLKQVDFFLFKSVVELINGKEHLTLLGLQKIVDIKASFNKGLPQSLKDAFPNWKPVPKPAVQFTKIQDPNWLAGFVNGDGSFSVTISSSKTNLTGYSVRLRLSISQHSRDLELLNSFTRYLNCGIVTLSAKLPNCYFSVTSLSDVVNIIVPFFEKYPMEGSKKEDFKDWCLIAKLMENKAHRTKAGLNQIIKIRNGMNLKR